MYASNNLTLKPGELVAGRFRIVRVIGSGGFSVVYHAHQEAMNRFVALKVLKPSASTDKKNVERFRRESLFASHLSHPNTITLFDYGQTDDGLCFIAMEYLEGQDLGEVVQRHIRMDLKRVWKILVQCSRSLAEAHRLGLVHRDLKPENIFLVNRDGEEFIKVLDFGVSKAITSFGGAGPTTMAPLTQEGTVFGTPLYMAPEQAMAEEVTPALDVYALGHITLEMITGHAAYEDCTNAMDVMLRQINDPPLKLPPPWDTTPFSTLVVQCTQKDPTRRIPDASKLLEVLLSEPFRPYMDPSVYGSRRNQTMNSSVEQASHGRGLEEDTEHVYQWELGVLEDLLKECDHTHEPRVVIIRGNPGVGRSNLVRAFLRSVRKHQGAHVVHRRAEHARSQETSLEWEVGSLLGMENVAHGIVEVKRLLQSAYGEEDDLGRSTTEARSDSRPLGSLSSIRGALLARAARPFREKANEKVVIWAIENLERVDALTLAFLDRLYRDLQSNPARILIVATVFPEDLKQRPGVMRYTQALLDCPRPMGRQFTIIPTTDENVPSNGISFDGSFLGMDPGMQQELQNIFLHSEEATKQHDPHDHQIKDAFDIVLGHLAQMGDEIPNELWLALQSKILDKRIVSKVDTVLSRAETFGIVSLSNTHIRFAQTSFAAALRKEFEKRPNAKASHRLIADGMEDFFERPNREQIKVIAQQRHLSDEPEAAVRLLQGAGEAAFQEFDLDAAREYFLQVQKLVDLESDEDQRISNTIDAQSIWMRLGEVHGALGEHGAAEDALSRVIATTSGGEIEARSYKLLGDLAMSQERYQDAIAYFDRARSAYTDLGTHSQAVALTGEMGRCLFFSGQTDEAERLIQEALNVGLKLENKDSSLLPTLYGNLGAIASSTSRLHEAREHHREEVRLAELADRQSILSTGLISLAKVAYAQCDFNSAEKASARAFEIGKTTPEGPGHHCIIWRTKVMAAQGMLREALSVLEDALDQSTASGDRANTAELLLCLGDISLASNRNTVATAHYEKVVEISDAVGFANLWMTAKIRLSYVALHQGNEPGIYAHLGAVMQRAQEHHDRPGELAVRAHIIYLQLLQHGFKAKGDTFSSLLHIDEATPLMEANIIAMLFKADDVTAKGDFENAQALLERTRSGASRIGDLGMMIMIQRRKRLVDAHQGKTTTTQAVDGYAVGAILPPEVGIRRFTSLPKSA